MANTFHVSVYVGSIPDAVEHYRRLLGIEPAKVKHDYAKFEIADPPVILSLSLGGEPGKLSHLGIRYPGTGDVASELVRVKNSGVPLIEQQGTTCCYAKADKFWVRDHDGIPWEMYTLLADVEAETAADSQLRGFLGQQRPPASAESIGSQPAALPSDSACGVDCCVPSEAPGS
ncbi:MAG: ArsI/CadI family heavy metal resistance metalloenzyme [Deltaproteobacteria bacterium]|nr:ArsI/CadI family heavy metal resistance metalloenzyme [Deltaproteobacteria bacterium]